MKKLKKFTHSVVVHTSVLSLLIFPLPAVSQDGLDRAAQMGIGLIQSVGNSVVQVKQQQAALQQQAAMMNGMRIQLRPARFFPNCQVPPAQTAIPENACSQISHPSQLGMAMGMQQAAVQNEALFEQMTSLAQNTPRPVGLQCLNEAKKQTAASMQDRLNALTALQNRINKETQLFKDENKQLVEAMAKDNAILNGSNNASNSMDIKNENLAKNFSPDCQNLNGGIGGINKAIRSGGLMGMLNGKMDDFQTMANNYKSNEAVHKKDIDNMVQKMIRNMKKEGVEGLDIPASQLKGINPGIAKNVQLAMGEQKAELLTYKNNIQGKIDDLLGKGVYNIPNFDQNFSVDFAEFKAGASNYFQKQYVNECVTGSGNNSIGLSTDSIMRGMRQRGVSGGNSLKKYQEALKNILDSDAFIEDKLAEIRALDAKFSKGRSRIEVSYTNTEAKEVITSPYQLYMDTIKACQQKFTQNDQFSTQNRTISMKKKVQRLQGYLNNIKRKHDTFIADAAAKTTDALVNCSGAEMKSGPGSCNPQSLSPGSQGFQCLSHSAQCASQVNSCYGQISQFVDKKKTELKAKAATYNKNVEGLVARQEQLLSAVKQQVLRDSEFLKQFFPGANYALPPDLFVKVPELSENNPFGVPMRGTPSLEFLKSLPGNIEKLKNQLAQQSKKVDEAIGTYMGEQKTAMMKNLSNWKKLKTQCAAAEKAFRQQVAQADKQRRDEFAKKKGEIGEFCNKFGKLRDRAPSDGACGEVESLYGDTAKVVAHVHGDVMSDLNAYQRFCDQREEADKAAENEDDESDGKLLSKMCKRHGNWDNVKRELISNLKEKLPSDVSYNDIQSYVEGSGQLSDSVKTAVKGHSGLMDNLDAVRDINTTDFKSPDKHMLALQSIKEDSQSSGDASRATASTNSTNSISQAISDISAMSTNAKFPQGLKDVLSSGQRELNRMKTRGAKSDEIKRKINDINNSVQAYSRNYRNYDAEEDCKLRNNMDPLFKPLAPTDTQEKQAWEIDKKICGLKKFEDYFDNQVLGNLNGYFDPSGDGSIKEGVVLKDITLPPLPSPEPLDIEPGSHPPRRTPYGNFKYQHGSLKASLDIIKEMERKPKPLSRVDNLKLDAAKNDLPGKLKQFHSESTTNRQNIDDQKEQLSRERGQALAGDNAHKSEISNELNSIAANIVDSPEEPEENSNVAGCSGATGKLKAACDEINDTANDGCANKENEIVVKAHNRCAEAENYTDCYETKKEELEESYQGLLKSNSLNAALMNANKGRGIASSKDWSEIGENSGDACEVTASNGRNFGGFSLGEFDMQTGAAPLGDFGLGQ